jgi:hypothetical protein
MAIRNEDIVQSRAPVPQHSKHPPTSHGTGFYIIKRIVWVAAQRPFPKKSVLFTRAVFTGAGKIAEEKREPRI